MIRIMLASLVTVLCVATAHAADLNVTTKSEDRVVIRKKRVAVLVRDYDGTPVLVRRGPPGTLVHVPVLGAAPSRYFNGQPVQPSTRPRTRVVVY